MTEREQFEALYGIPIEQRRATSAGGYAFRNFQLMWGAWQASRRSALEEAVKVCDEISVDCWNLYKGRAPYTGTEPGRADPHVQGESDGADKCADAIRALKEGGES